VYVTEEPTDLENTKRCHKFPFVACEIFSCEVTPLMQQLVEDRDLLDKLFSVLRPDTIHPTLAGYFSKVFLSLLKTVEEPLLKELCDSQLTKEFVRHMHSRSIADALCRVIGLDDRPFPFYVPMRVEAIRQVVALIEPSQSYETCSNAGNLLLEVIQRSKETNAWGELIKAITQRDILERLVSQVTCPELYVVKATVSVLSALCSSDVLSLYKGSEQDEEATLMQDEEDTPALVELLIARVSDISKQLKRPPTAAKGTTFKVSGPVLGEGRLRLIELVNAILRIDDAALLGAIANSDLLEVITGLFEEFKWNSLLHGVYEQLVLAVLRTNSTDLKSSLFARARIPSVLIRLGEAESRYGNGVLMRPGHAGHITRIANILDNSAKTQDYVRGVLDGTSRWREFYGGTVTSQNEVESRTLGGKKSRSPAHSISSEDEDQIDIKPEVRPTQRFSSWKLTTSDQVEEPEELE
jgi:hypothetical protein